MMPPPTTSMRLGIDGSSSAPVESTTRGSFGMNGSFIASLPAAMIALSKRIVFFAAIAARELNFEMMRIDEAADAAYDVDPARLCHACKAARQLPDDTVLEASQLVEVDGRHGVADAVLAHRLHFIHHGRGVQQSLRRNAADIEAHAAKCSVA